MSMPEAVATLDSLERDVPWIPWRTPVPITVPGLGRGLGCRVCVAAVGFHGLDVVGLPQTPEEFAEHFLEAHGAEAAV